MRRPPIRAAIAAALAAACLSAGAAVAQEDPQRTAAARALFEQGVEAFDRGALDEAEDRFRRSLAIRPSTSVSYNLAMVLAERGGLVEAQELLHVVIADDEAPGSLRADAARRAEALRGRIPQLTVVADAGEATIRVDDRPLDAAMLGVPIPVDPGRRTVVAELDGRVVFERTLELREGAEERVAVRLPTPAEAAGTMTADTAPLETETSDGGGGVEPWVWVVVGVVAAAVIAGAIGIGVAVDEGRYFTGNVGPGRVGVD